MRNSKDNQDANAWNGQDRRCCPRWGAVDRIIDITYKIMREAKPDRSDDSRASASK